MPFWEWVLRLRIAGNAVTPSMTADLSAMDLIFNVGGNPSFLQVGLVDTHAMIHI
jgi:hypothetical protein